MLVCPEEDAGWVFARIAFTRSELLKLCQVALHEQGVTKWLLEVEQDCRERIMKELLPKQESGSGATKVSGFMVGEEHVTEWLLEATHDSIERVLQVLARDRATALEEALAVTEVEVKKVRASTLVPPVAPPAPGGHLSLGVEEDTDMCIDPEMQRLSNAMPEETIVSLASLSYFSTEGESHCDIDVMRMGNLDRISKVDYQTNPGSAKPGKTYHHTEGTLVFQPGESIQKFQVPLIDDDEWNTTLEFEAQLLGHSAINCRLDMYLNTAIVKVIDNDTFPTNKYSEQIKERKWKKIPGPGLLREYFKLNRSNPVVRSGTIKMILVDQLANLYFLLKLFMNVYLVDYVLSPDKAAEDLFLIHSKGGSLVLLLVATIVPFALLYYLDQRKFSWKVAGTSRSILQKSLLRKFLNYSEESRMTIDNGDLVMAMTRDAFKVVHDGYLNSLDVLKEAGKILLVLVYQFSAPFVFDTEIHVIKFMIPFLAFPTLLISFLLLRVSKTTANFTEMNECQDDLVDYVQSAVTNYRLIADYDTRSNCVDSFEALIKRFNAAFTSTSTVLGANNYFPRWVTVFIVSLYMVIGGQQAISGSISLGMFLADVRVFTEVGEAWGTMYKVLLEMQTCFSALERIVRLENLPTDVPQRAKLMRSNQKKTNSQRRAMEREGKRAHVDEMPIVVNNLQINASGKGGGINHKGELRVDQGTLVALVGNRGQGKATMLKVVSNVILPRTDVEDPGFFMPSHLRVLHISLEPMFFKGTLMHNLTFGVQKGTADGSPERVRRICERLHLGDEVLNVIESPSEQDWSQVFSQTTKGIINLARAFIANPEFMCIHKPTQTFDESLSHEVMKCLVEFKVKKGLLTDQSSWCLRRCRTCIFTSSESLNLPYVDSVVHTSRTHGIRILQKEDVTPDMFS